ncbi:regucalcin [Diabrotica virgifera virgifera]|uniref:Regucalcin n=1 Tax=Diabrotica virgifera virgifera TaxID=50390 RepID=A0A6P7FHT4_DIAVI|nr:regucalcin [Diabrotica virgifera virgifera]XP_028135457.1 regucalcin [Diabrotica virgifera virgifera]XP_050501742.1 regucalcin [Diabrotica virgifera virgifera]
MAPIIEKVLDGFKLAEGPHWDTKKQCLYFVDIVEGTIFKYVPSTKKLTKAKIGNHNVSIIIPLKYRNNEFIVTLNNSIALIEWDGESTNINSVKQIYEVDAGTSNVFNDGKCDKTGRIWAGTMGASPTSIGELVKGKGTLYNFFNNKATPHRDGIGISNGIAFDYKRGKMYYTDSFSFRVDQYDIDFSQGKISNMKTIFSIKNQSELAEETFCDGMTLDSDGNIWLALFNSSKVYQIDPSKPETVLRFVELPAAQITSVAFGGPNLDELYVTSGNLSDRPGGQSPGSIFRVTGLNVKGLPADEAIL